MPSAATSPMRARSSPIRRFQSATATRRALFIDVETSTPRSSMDDFNHKEVALAQRIEQRSAATHGQQLLAAAAAFERAALTITNREDARIGMHKL